MIRLRPATDTFHKCPYCQVLMDVKGWYIPGMRNLAKLECTKCNREFFGDLPAGHGLNYPMLLEAKSGEVFDIYGVAWFSDWLAKSYQHRTSISIEIETEKFREIHEPILLNCLDTLYGHCLLKLLNAQFYIDHCPEQDLIILVPKFLRWMVPKGAAEIWTVDLPLKRGAEWNDWLAAEIKRRLDGFEQVWLSLALSHPHPSSFQLERFTDIKPFDSAQWETVLEQPVITFIWRNDRLWSLLPRYMKIPGLRRYLPKTSLYTESMLKQQNKKVTALANTVRETFPGLDFAITGLGNPGGLPHWIKDMRTISVDQLVERRWCERFSKSHLVLGVHGSNMLIPSAQAGSVIELVPQDRWGNIIQDLLIQGNDGRDILYRYRLLPLSISPRGVALTAINLIKYYGDWNTNMLLENSTHGEFKNHPENMVRLLKTIV